MAIDPLEVVVKIQNRQELDKLTIDAAKAEVEIKKLNVQLQTGAINAGQFATAAKPFADSIAASVPPCANWQASRVLRSTSCGWVSALTLLPSMLPPKSVC